MSETTKTKEIPVAIQRLLDEVRAEKAEAANPLSYNRAHNRHNRSGSYNTHNRTPPPREPS